MTLVPDLAEPVGGWRVWNVVSGERGPELVSPMRPVVWPHRAPTTAVCDEGCRCCPSTGGRCGLYAMAGLNGLPLAGLAIGTVLGCVGLWGHVVEHSGGWRGEHGYPLVLIVMSAAQSDVATRVRRLSRLQARGSFTASRASSIREDVDAVIALSRELARLYAVPVHPAPTLVDIDPIRGERPSARIADVVLGEAVTGLARRRGGDPEARARLDRRVQDLIDSCTA